MRDYVVAPGGYLAEWMEEHPGMTQAQLADKVGVSRKQINAILNGRAPITAATATSLGRVTAIPAKAWLMYQAHYDAEVAELSDEAHLANYAGVISKELGAYLRKIGATSATMRTPGRLVGDFLAFVGCGTYDAFERRCATELAGGQVYSTLRESGKEIDPAMLLAWVANAERQDAKGARFHRTYAEAALRDAIPQVRSRAQRPDSTLLADIQALLAEAGVTLLYCDPPSNFPLHGLTYWVCGAPVILVTARRRTDGYVIWAIFHELGHVLNDDRTGGTYGLAKARAQRDLEEKAANAFAREALFGASGLSPFYGLSSPQDICSAAAAVGVSPGVAVVAMHRKRMLDYAYGNDLLVEVV